MHLCHALYRLGGEQYLMPMAEYVGFKYLQIDFLLNKWNKQDQFLLLFCDAFIEWFQGGLRMADFMYESILTLFLNIIPKNRQQNIVSVLPDIKNRNVCASYFIRC
jgi:hypothetical protein